MDVDLIWDVFTTLAVITVIVFWILLMIDIMATALLRVIRNIRKGLKQDELETEDQ